MKFPAKYRKHHYWLKKLMEDACIEIAIKCAKWKDPLELER